MARNVLPALALIALSWTASAALAGDIDAGKAKAAVCASCHGANGISAVGMWPNLAGQKTAYLTKQLEDFRAGTRSDLVMAGMAKGLSDSDIDNLAAFYASLPAGGN